MIEICLAGGATERVGITRYLLNGCGAEIRLLGQTETVGQLRIYLCKLGNSVSRSS